MAIPTRNQTAKTTADAFYHKFIIHYGIPTRLHSDQGANFESDIIKELCQLTNMKKSHTSIYDPQGNAGPERFNRTLISMLGTRENSQKADWKKYINSLVFAYNSIPHESTRISPYELMFGRKPKLPIDAMFEEAREDRQTNKGAQEYISDLRERIQKAREIADKFVEKAKTKQKLHYDKKVRKGGQLEVGDQVLVRILARGEGKHKLADKYEEEMYTVIELLKDGIPVYVVRGNETNRIRKLHRNYLFPLDYRVEPEVKDDSVAPDAVQEEKQIQEDEKKEASIIVEEEELDRSDVTEGSDDETGVVFVTPTITYGDAHEPRTYLREDEVVTSDSKAEEEIDATAEEIPETATAESETDKEVKDNSVPDSTDSNTKDNTRVLSENTDQVIEETVESQEDEIVEAGTDNTQEESINESETTVQLDETTVAPLNETEVTDNGNREPSVIKKKRKQKKLPPDPPRRSERVSRIPDRLGPYITFSINNRPYDTRFEALESMISSGVLASMDSEVARKVIRAMIE